MKYVFPNNFILGNSSSSVQSEGTFKGDNKAPSIWDDWFEREPNRFFQGVGPSLTTDFYHRYKEDILLMKEAGLKGFRTSLQWSRLLPDPWGEPNNEAIIFYNNILDETIKAGIEPSFALFHFDMPLALQKEGGFENRDLILKAFSRYAEIAFDLFGDKVKHWYTFNEPIVPVEGGYLYDFHPPHVVDFKRAATVAYHTIIAHSTIVEIFKKKNLNSTIGIILNLTPSYPRSQNEYDLKASFIADLFFNRSFLDPVLKGSYPKELVDLLREYDQLPEVKEGDKELINKGIIKDLGINYYCPRRVKGKEYAKNPQAPFMPDDFFDIYEMPGRKMNPYRGWEIYPKGIYDILINLKDNYGNPSCFISENGMGVENEDRFRNSKGQIEDVYRIEFVKDHLIELNKALQEGSACYAYFMWAFIDNWSWMNAFKNRYGMVEVDLSNDLRRKEKLSYSFMREFNKNKFFES